MAQRWQGAAALSAAVTITNQQETAPTSHGREPPKERTSLFPATLRERGSGGEALLLEKRPLPQKLPFSFSHHIGGVDFKPCVGVFAGGAGEGGDGGQEAVGFGLDEELEEHLVATLAAKKLHGSRVHAE